jgi:hypothetical protein
VRDSAGADIRKLGIAADPVSPGHTVLALREAVRAGELLLKIPFNLSVTSDWGGDPLMPQVGGEGVPPFWRLVARLLRHRAAGSDSPYAPYIATLPSTHPLPLGWPAEELRLLRGTRVHTVVAEQQISISEAVATLFPTAEWAGEELEWAAAMVWSRAFSHADETGQQAYTMVPFLDSANHGARLVARAAERQRLVVRDSLQGARFVYAPQAMPAGSEYLHDYGALSHAELFSQYGFVPGEPNPDDRVDIHVDLTSTPERVRAMLYEAGVTKEHSQPSLGPVPLYAEGLSRRLITATRLAMLRSEGELSAWGSVVEGHPASMAGETRVHDALKAACNAELAAIAACEQRSAARAGWSGGAADHLAALEAVDASQRSAASTRLLAVLRLLHHTRKVLLRNVDHFAALLEESRESLAQPHGRASAAREEL